MNEEGRMRSAALGEKVLVVVRPRHSQFLRLSDDLILHADNRLPTLADTDPLNRYVQLGLD